MSSFILVIFKRKPVFFLVFQALFTTVMDWVTLCFWTSDIAVSFMPLGKTPWRVPFLTEGCPRQLIAWKKVKVIHEPPTWAKWKKIVQVEAFCSFVFLFSCSFQPVLAGIQQATLRSAKGLVTSVCCFDLLPYEVWILQKWRIGYGYACHCRLRLSNGSSKRWFPSSVHLLFRGVETATSGEACSTSGGVLGCPRKLVYGWKAARPTQFVLSSSKFLGHLSAWHFEGTPFTVAPWALHVVRPNTSLLGLWWILLWWYLTPGKDFSREDCWRCHRNVKETKDTLRRPTWWLRQNTTTIQL